MAGNETERRRKPRVKLPCPIRLTQDGGGSVSASTINISDVGVYASVPSAWSPAPERVLKLKLIVPRYTDSTFMLEEFSCLAKLVRRQPLDDEQFAGVALEFATPMRLSLHE